jgi:hypothetical protein
MTTSSSTVFHFNPMPAQHRAVILPLMNLSMIWDRVPSIDASVADLIAAAQNTLEMQPTVEAVNILLREFSIDPAAPLLQVGTQILLALQDQDQEVAPNTVLFDTFGRPIQSCPIRRHRCRRIRSIPSLPS